jgi:hypothetical protein
VHLPYKNRKLSRTVQLLLNRGLRWRDVFLAMFTIYIDDSGTDPSQRVAIASVLIVPAARITALDREWKALKEKEGFTSFHMSECAAFNKNSEFAGWDDAKQQRVISRVRRLGMKFGLKGLSLAINKVDYDEVVSSVLKYTDEYHYTWAIRNILSLIDRWAQQANVTLPLEYVYDWMDPKTQREAKAEIDTVMAQAEELACEAGKAGRYTNYSFRRRQDIPALQCTDALAWTCYRFALFAHQKVPLNPIAQESWDAYSKHQNGTWLYAIGAKREHLKDWAEREIKDGRSLERFKAWEEKRASQKVV